MKIAYALGIATVSAMLAISGSAFAQSTQGQADPPDTSNDSEGTLETGGPAPSMQLFGVDIAGAGTSTESVQQFLAGLTAEQQAAIRDACVGVNDGTNTTADEASKSFCLLVTPM